MKRILTINEYWSDNLGDVAIGETVKKYCLLNGYSVDCVDYTKQSKYEIGEITYKEVNNKKIIQKIKNKVKEIFPITKTIIWFKNNWRIFWNIRSENYDKVIIGGGQLLLSNGYFPIALLVWFFIVKKFMKAEIYLVGVGTGDKIEYQDKIIFKLILPKFDGIYIRDRESVNKLSSISKKIKMELIPDIVYSYNQLFPHGTLIKENIFLVGIMDFKTINKIIQTKYSSEEEYMDHWFDLINKYSKNFTVKLCYNTYSDKKQTYVFKKYCKEKYGVDFEILKTDKLDELTSALSVSNAIMSARMHAMILGLNFECEVIPFVFSDKLRSFKSEIEDNFNIRKLQQEINNKMDNILRYE